MKRLLKWISIFLGLAVLAVITAIIIMTSVINPNQYKSVMISEFKQFTGFEIAIPGDLSWSFFPNLGMEASEVTVSDPTVFTATLKNLVLRAKFGALLHKQLDISKVSIGTLVLNQLQATNVHARIHFQNKVLEIKHVHADLYQGALNTEAAVSLKEDSPTWQVKGKLDKVDIAGLLQGLSGKAPKLQVNGRGDLNWDVTTQGKKTEELLGHLNGKGRVNVSNGSLKGIDLAYFVNTAAALINKQPLPAKGSTGETPFGQLTGTAVIKDGILTTEDLALDSPLYSVKATGTMDLVNKTLDYHLDVSAKASKKTNKLLALYGKTVPVRVSGSLSDPSVTLDTLALMKEVGKEQLQRLGQEIQKALPDKTNSFIKSLFH